MSNPYAKNATREEWADEEERVSALAKAARKEQRPERERTGTAQIDASKLRAEEYAVLERNLRRGESMNPRTKEKDAALLAEALKRQTGDEA